MHAHYEYPNSVPELLVGQLLIHNEVVVVLVRDEWDAVVPRALATALDRLRDVHPDLARHPLHCRRREDVDHDPVAEA